MGLWGYNFGGTFIEVEQLMEKVVYYFWEVIGLDCFFHVLLFVNFLKNWEQFGESEK